MPVFNSSRILLSTRAGAFLYWNITHDFCPFICVVNRQRSIKISFESVLYCSWLLSPFLRSKKRATVCQSPVALFSLGMFPNRAFISHKLGKYSHELNESSHKKEPPFLPVRALFCFLLSRYHHAVSSIAEMSRCR